MPRASVSAGVLLGGNLREAAIRIEGGTVSSDVSETAVQIDTSTAYGMAIPANSAFLGVQLFAQGGVFIPGINALSLAASNGVHGVIGNL